jgi:hypothetical protein
MAKRLQIYFHTRYLPLSRVIVKSQRDPKIYQCYKNKTIHPDDQARVAIAAIHNILRFCGTLGGETFRHRFEDQVSTSVHSHGGTIRSMV